MHEYTIAVTTGTCTYDRFRHDQGEPRGLEYRQVYEGPDGILNGSGFRRFAPDYD